MRIPVPYGNVLKRFMPRTLFWRTVMIIIVPAMLLQVIVCFIFLERHWSAVGFRLATAVSGDAAMTLRQFEDMRGSASEEDIVEQIAELMAGKGLHISFDPTGVLTGEHGKIGRWLNMSPVLTEILERDIPRDFLVGTAPGRDRFVEIRIAPDPAQGGGVLTIGMIESRLFTSTAYIFVLWMLGSSVLLFSIAVLFMRNQIRPIRRLAVAVDRFGRGLDAPRFRPEGALEVRQAAAAFLKMRERIRRQIEQRTAMLNGISHDLRTPVTRMKIEVEMLEDTETAAGLKSDLEAMEKMLDGYLAFAKGDQEEAPESVMLDKLLLKTVEDAQRQGCVIDCDTGKWPSAQAQLRPLALARALGNILENACKYGTKAYVTLARIENEDGRSAAEIRIEDDGPGIPEKLREDVFKPFLRLEESRNPETGGVGLGLSVAQDILHAHGGQILLEDRIGGKSGLCVRIRLPL